MSFHLLSSSIQDALKANNYIKPTPIQESAIPVILDNKDVLAAAQTGTGKTAAFALPIIEKLLNSQRNSQREHPRALILAPTKELVRQIAISIQTYSKNSDLNTYFIVGGVSAETQKAHLETDLDILVATPGRLIEHLEKKHVNLLHVDTFVLDEADRLLDMGFMNELDKITPFLRKSRQNLMFSVSFTKAIKKLAKSILINPTQINLSDKKIAKSNIEQRLHPVDCEKKLELLSYVIGSQNIQNAIVFVETKVEVEEIEKHLKLDGIKAVSIHGNKTQAARAKALAQFKEKKAPILVATDIASRGIDIADLAYVINADLPNNVEDYVHRVGRCGRAGRSGISISLVCEAEHDRLHKIERFIKMNIERIIIDGFEPSHKQKRQTAQKKMQKEGPKPKKNVASKNSNNRTKSNTKFRKTTKRG